MKPLGHKNYGSIPHLLNSKLGEKDYHIHEGQERILTIKTRDKHDEVLAFEKYDGSNIGIAMINSEIIALTRAGYEATTSKYEQHHLFAEWVKNNEERIRLVIKNGERVTGEWMAQAHGMQYIIENDPVIFFDHFNTKNKRSLYDYLEYKANKGGLQLARLLWRGAAVSVENLKPILNKKTFNVRSYDKPEGIVYRVERNGNVDFLAKWIRSDYKTGQFLFNDPLVWNWKIKK